MRFFLALAALAAAPLSAAQDANAIVQQAIQRALIQRDQQSAEFANRRLESLHARQLQELAQRPPVIQARPEEKPLPLPGGPRHGVDPIPAQGLGH